LVEQLVIFGHGHMVRDVLVGGRRIMRNREILTVDENEARENCREAAESMWNLNRVK